MCVYGVCACVCVCVCMCVSPHYGGLSVNITHETCS